MKRKDRLTKRLYYLSVIGFYGMILFTAHIISRNFYEADNFTAHPHFKSGYSIPVKMNVGTLNDSLLTYKGQNVSGMMSSSINETSKERKDGFYSKLHDSTLTKKLFIKTAEIRDQEHNDISSNFNNIMMLRAQGYVALNPKSTGHKILFAAKSYLFMVCLIFVLWHIMQFFKSLKNNFEFSRNLNRRLWITGNAILCYQVINMLLCLAIEQIFSRIEVKGSSIPSALITIYPEIEFNLGYVFIGLSLVVLSKLLYLGNDIQQENELTI